MSIFQPGDLNKENSQGKKQTNGKGGWCQQAARRKCCMGNNKKKKAIVAEPPWEDQESCRAPGALGGHPRGFGIASGQPTDT